MARRKKRAIVDDKYITFLTDDDGLTGKDYLLVISTGIFFLFVAVGLIAVILGHTFDGMYLELLEMTVPVVMTVVGGVMGVQAVESFRKPKNDAESTEEDEII